MGKIKVSKDMKEKFVDLLEKGAHLNNMNVSTFFEHWIFVSTMASSGALFALGGLSEGEQRLDACTQEVEKLHSDTVSIFLQLSDNLRMELGKEPRDILGELYMSLGSGKDSLGQVFTPLHIAKMMAQMTMTPLCLEKQDEPLNINDAACGSGVMAIASHLCLQQNGKTTSDYNFVLQDFDALCCRMAFLQMEMLGISAIVYNDDSLARPFGPNADIEKMYVTTQYFANNRGLELVDDCKSA